MISVCNLQDALIYPQIWMLYGINITSKLSLSTLKTVPRLHWKFSNSAAWNMIDDEYSTKWVLERMIFTNICLKLIPSQETRMQWIQMARNYGITGLRKTKIRHQNRTFIERSQLIKYNMRKENLHTDNVTYWVMETIGISPKADTQITI